ncbi:MAG: acetoin utilization protein AcuC [Nitriliruptorales bacterium]|nr:acetoin utilization protein AcuC [Nitriliruptorales bacterium]
MTEGRSALVWDGRLAAYDFGRGHPLAPVRVELTVELIRACGLLETEGVEPIEPSEVPEDELLAVHDPDYVTAVRRASEDPQGFRDLRHGLGPGDNPTFAGMHDASVRVCGASKAAAQAVWRGDVLHAFNPAGGLHHAMPDRAAGFCVYNDPAIAIQWMLDNGAERVGYVDVDVHHGDGVEMIFRDDPRVLTVSLHESGRFLFPGTGTREDIGGPNARGFAANLPFHPGTTGDIWLDAFDEAVVPLLRSFDPQVLVTQLGCDTHATDPLAHLALTVDDDAAIYARLHRLAHELCEGRWIATGGGGYQLVSVVPRAWTLAFAEMTGASLPVETPMSWREVANQRTGERAPTDFTDDPVRVSEEITEAARRAADESVAAIEERVLPHHT